MVFVCDHGAKILAFGVLALGVFVSNAGFVCFPQISQIGADFFVSDFRFQISDFRFQISDFCFPQIARMDADFFCLRWYGIFAAYVRKFPCLRAEKERRKVLTRKANGLVALSAGHRPADRGKRQGARGKKSASICEICGKQKSEI